MLYTWFRGDKRTAPSFCGWFLLVFDAFAGAWANGGERGLVFF